jgi:hypothetical protein
VHCDGQHTKNSNGELIEIERFRNITKNLLALCGFAWVDSASNWLSLSWPPDLCGSTSGVDLLNRTHSGQIAPVTEFRPEV